MKSKKNYMVAVALFGLAATSINAQVAINNTAATPDASAILDLKTGNTGVNKGFLPQSVALTNVTIAAPVTSPATGLLVYSSTAPTGGNGTGYYYWNGSTWASMNYVAGIGGSGTDNYVARWTPNGSTLGIGKIEDNGTDVSIDTLPLAGYNLFVNGDRSTGVIAAIDNNGPANSIAILGENPNYVGVAGAATAKISAGVYGISDSGWGLYGISNLGTGLYVEGDSLGAIVMGDTGISARGSYDGIQAYGTNWYGIFSHGGYGGVYGYGNEVGVYAQSEYFGLYAYASNGYGVYGIGSGTSGNGVFSYSYDAAGDSSIGSTYGLYANSSNGSFAGVYGEDDGSIGYGVWGVSSGSSSTGVVGTSNGTGGEGVSGYGTTIGGYFADAGGTYSYIDYSGYGILSNGVKSTMVKDENNKERVLFCDESPEVMFHDYGTSQLVHGKVHIDIDPLLAKNVAINEKHPLRVMVTLNDADCNGVAVINRTATGFDVVELAHGTSNAAFTYEIIANRANENNSDKAYADMRFPVGPNAQAMAKKAPEGKVSIPTHPAVLSKNPNAVSAAKPVNGPLKVTLPGGTK